MLQKKEITAIIITVIILGFTLSLVQTPLAFLFASLAIFLVIAINVFAKKIMSYYLDSEIEIKLWEIKRYGFAASAHLKRAFPAGIFFPIILTTLTFGAITWLAPLVFEIKPKIYRAAKRYGLYKFSEVTEFHIGIIAATGIFANLLFAFIAYLVGTPAQLNFVKLNIYFAFFNMLPLGNLDGNKIFFGNLIIWSFLAILTLIGLGYAVFLI